MLRYYVYQKIVLLIIELLLVFYCGGIKAVELTITHSLIGQSKAFAPIFSIPWCLTPQASPAARFLGGRVDAFVRQETRRKPMNAIEVRIHLFDLRCETGCFLLFRTGLFREVRRRNHLMFPSSSSPEASISLWSIVTLDSAADWPTTT